MVEFVDEAMLNNHKLYYSGSRNSYPVMRREMHNKVLGELYRINNPLVVDTMDEIEGEGSLYDRIEVKVFTSGAKMYTASTYIGNTSFWDFDVLTEVSNKKLSEWR